MTGSKSSSRTRVRPSTSTGSTAKPKPTESVVALGTGTGTGGGRAGIEAGCAGLAETLVLMSPVAAVLATLKADDELVVERRGKPVLAVHLGHVAGSIIPAELTKLLDCLDRGFKFAFTVRSVVGSRCEGTLHCVDKP
jgi:hypothetical protein